MMESMNNLAKAHSNLLFVTKISESYLKNNNSPRAYGEYDIPMGGHDTFTLNITASGTLLLAPKGRFLITSGMHARENAPIAHAIGQGDGKWLWQ
jgi:hypothetical protein